MESKTHALFVADSNRCEQRIFFKVNLVSENITRSTYIISKVIHHRDNKYCVIDTNRSTKLCTSNCSKSKALERAKGSGGCIYRYWLEYHRFERMFGPKNYAYNATTIMNLMLKKKINGYKRYRRKVTASQRLISTMKTHDPLMI